MRKQKIILGHSGRALPGAASIPKDCRKIMSEKEKKDKNFLASHIQIIHYGKIRQGKN